jgi:hypothetical protein
MDCCDFSWEEIRHLTLKVPSSSVEAELYFVRCPPHTLENSNGSRSPMDGALMRAKSHNSALWRWRLSPGVLKDWMNIPTWPLFISIAGIDSLSRRYALCLPCLDHVSEFWHLWITYSLLHSLILSSWAGQVVVDAFKSHFFSARTRLSRCFCSVSS